VVKSGKLPRQKNMAHAPFFVDWVIDLVIQYPQSGY
jgi:hypothetical protein